MDEQGWGHEFHEFALIWFVLVRASSCNSWLSPRMQISLRGAAHVTNSRSSIGAMVNPSGASGIEVDSRTFRVAVSNRKTQWEVAQAINRVFPSFVAASAVGER